VLRRLVRENHRQQGYVVQEGERIDFGVNADRRRAIAIDLSKTELVSEDDFPADDPDGDAREALGGWGKRYGA
jgi:hypothetical protein